MKVAEPGQTLADDVARVAAVRDASAPTAGCGSTPTGRGRRRGGRVDPRAGSLRPRVRRAAVGDRGGAGRRSGAGSTCRSRPTSPSAAPTTRCGSGSARGGRHRRAQGAAAGRGSRVPCASPSRSGCRSWSPVRSSRPSGSEPVWHWRLRSPSCPYACGLATTSMLTRDVTQAPDDAGRRATRRCGGSGPTLTWSRPPGRRGLRSPPGGWPGWPLCRRLLEERLA